MGCAGAFRQVQLGAVVHLEPRARPIVVGTRDRREPQDVPVERGDRLAAAGRHGDVHVMERGHRRYFRRRRNSTRRSQRIAITPSTGAARLATDPPATFTKSTGSGSAESMRRAPLEVGGVRGAGSGAPPSGTPT